MIYRMWTKWSCVQTDARSIDGENPPDGKFVTLTIRVRYPGMEEAQARRVCMRPPVWRLILPASEDASTGSG